MKLVSTVKRKALLTIGLAVVLSAFSFATAGTALAAPYVTASTSVSCSSKNGVATAKITVRVTERNGADLTLFEIDVDKVGDPDTGPEFSGDALTGYVSVTGNGEYNVAVFIDSNANDLAYEGKVKISNGRCSASLKSVPVV